MKQFTGWLIMDPSGQFAIDGAKFLCSDIEKLTFSQLKNRCYGSDGQANKIVDEIYIWSERPGDPKSIFRQRATNLIDRFGGFTIYPIELKFLSTDGPKG